MGDRQTMDDPTTPVNIHRRDPLFNEIVSINAGRDIIAKLLLFKTIDGINNSCVVGFEKRLVVMMNVKPSNKSQFQKKSHNQFAALKHLMGGISCFFCAYIMMKTLS